MIPLPTPLKKIDLSVLACTLGLSGLGLVSIYSSSFFRNGFLNFRKQVVFLIIGFSLMFFLARLDWRLLRDSRFLLLCYFTLLLLLCGLLFLGKRIRGIRGWYRLGFLSFDPVPFMEAVLILVLAKYFSLRHVELYNLKHIFVSGLYALFPFALVFFQPDLGSALLFFFVWLGILVVSGIRLKHFLLLLFLFLLLSGLAWSFLLKPYQKERLADFVFPERDIRRGGWSQRQALIGLGSGGFWGKGFKKGTQVQLGFLTFPQTDFIFAAIGEEFGLAGVMALLLLMLYLCFRIVKVAYKSKTNFPRLFAFGFSLLLITKTFIHAGVNLGLLPVVGLSLPFVSYGGSEILAHFVCLGILQSINTHPEK